MEKKKYKTEETGHYSGVMPKMTVMQPTVVNVSNPPENESVSSQEIDDLLLPDIEPDK